MRFDDDGAPRRKSYWAIILILIAGTLLGISSYVWWLRPLRNVESAKPRETQPSTPPDNEEREAINLFKMAKESVVNVDTVLFRRGSDLRVQAVQAETGSGFIWDDAGHVVTNYHVVRDVASKRGQLVLRVVLADRSEWRASIVGTAPDVDLAVIRIQAPTEKLKKIAVGRSEGLQVGQKAYAIGNPLGLSLSMTKGIVSALDREIDSPTGRSIPGAIQIDAPINPGNSGGPLLNKDGLLIGVNTSIATLGGGNIGIGFAIPVDTVNSVVPELIANGRMLQPDLGVRLVDQRRLRRAGFPNGVMLGFVEPGSPADQAALKALSTDPQTGEITPGDLIIKWNGKEIRSNNEFEQLLARAKAGAKVTLTIERDDQVFDVEVTLRAI